MASGAFQSPLIGWQACVYTLGTVPTVSETPTLQAGTCPVPKLLNHATEERIITGCAADEEDADLHPREIQTRPIRLELWVYFKCLLGLKTWSFLSNNCPVGCGKRRLTAPLTARSSDESKETNIKRCFFRNKTALQAEICKV